MKPAAIGLACCAALGAQGAVGTQPPLRFRAGVDAVRVDVLVTDRNRPVGGLTAADFVLLDNDVPQQIEAIHSEDMPVSMMLALDTSASVAGAALRDLKDAASAALATLDHGDRAALLTFSAEVLLRGNWTGNRDRVMQAITDTRAGGGTALGDAAYAAMTLRDAEPGRRSLVLLFTDGNDTASWLPDTAVIDRAQRIDAVVYGISLASEQRPEVRLMYRSGIELTHGSPLGLSSGPLVDQLADITGGQSFTAENTSRLASAFTQIVKEFRSRYLLIYTPRDVAFGGWHTIDVRLKTRKGQIRARRGYLR
jgi:Ca-activated chloride channel family protein